MSLNDLIPGLREVIARDREFELEGFIGIEPSICGVVYLRPFTPRMFIALQAVKNGYVYGDNPPTVADALQLLWRCSEKFDPNDQQKRSDFWKFCTCLPAAQTHEEIQQYLIRAWRSMPFGQSKHDAATITSWPSVLVNLIAAEYGWSEDAILDLPFRRLFQYAHRIIERRDPDHKQVSQDGMRLRVEFLKKLNGERRKKS